MSGRHPRAPFPQQENTPEDEIVMTDASGLRISATELDALLEKAATRGAERALRELGLEDPDDRDDLREALDFARLWRKARSSAFDAAVKAITMALLTAVAAGIAMGLIKQVP